MEGDEYPKKVYYDPWITLVIVVFVSVIFITLTFVWQEMRMADKFNQLLIFKTNTVEEKEKSVDWQKYHDFVVEHDMDLEFRTASTKLYTITRTGEKELIAEFDKTYCEFAFPSLGKYIYLIECFPESSEPRRNIMSFNLETEELKALDNINKVIVEENDSWGSKTLSPDKTKFAYTSGPSVDVQGELMYLMDLEKDITEIVATLDTNETFDKGCGGISSEYDIEWPVPMSVFYYVYEKQTSGPCDSLRAALRRGHVLINK